MYKVNSSDMYITNITADRKMKFTGEYGWMIT
jgi:hypothetical protein